MSEETAEGANEPIENAIVDGAPFYTTYLSHRSVVGHHHYFKTDDPARVDGNVWLRVWRGSAILSVMAQAFDKGSAVKVQIDYPHTSPDGQKTSTVQYAEIIWQPRSYLEGIPEVPSRDPEEGELAAPLLRSPVSHFSLKKHLVRKNGRLHGQWHRTFSRACGGAPTTFFEEQSILEIFDVGECSDGQTVVICTHY